MNRRTRRQAAKTGRGASGSRPSAPELHQVLATAARDRGAGRLDRAGALYRRALKLAPHQPDALHWLGVLEHKRGRDERAVALLERAAALRPGDALCHFHLAEVRRALGRYGEAVASYRQALSLASGVADIHYGLGTALLELGRAEQAAAELCRAVELSPDDPEGHNNLANALAEAGRVDAAVAHYRTALTLRPGYAEAHLNLGLAMAQQGRDEEAEGCLRGALAADPKCAAAWRQLGRLLRRSGRPEEALEAFRQATESAPRSATAAYELGEALRALERHDAADEWYGKAIRLAPDFAEAHNALGHCLVKLRRFAAALGHYRKAVELKPDFAEAHFNIGVCLQSEGRFDEAVRAHERALALRPDLAKAHYNLAEIKRNKADERAVAPLQELLARSDLADEERINANFAIAKIYEDRGDTESAFAHYRRGNELKARHLPFDAGRHVDYVNRLIATFDAGFFAARADFGVVSELPIFIVGMARSGTTLVEQILSSHSAVHGAGELDDIRHMVSALPQRLGPGTPYPECVAEVDRDTAHALAQEYLDSLRRLSPVSSRVTDKMTGNYLRLGLIAQLLPKATVIHCRRDPVDTCLSCYFQNFANGLRFTYDLSHLGLVYREYERLMAHWHRVLPVPMFEVRYEELIADQEAVSRRIVASCGLPWDASCLRFYEQAQQVRTASFWQVRQPIYTSSVGRWRGFAKHLGRLFETLGHPDSVGG